MSDIEITWLGQSTFRIDTPGAKRLYFDPWLTDNPRCPENELQPERCDVIALTHGHTDHIGDTIEIANRFDAPVVAIFELRCYLSQHGLEAEDPTVTNNWGLTGNKGGTVEQQGLKFTFTDAKHTNSVLNGLTYELAGDAAGIVVEFENGYKIYNAGDTCAFMDMQLIARIHEPDLVILPIGGHFTMDHTEAAVALELLGATRCIPCHYGTLRTHTGDPKKLQELAPDVEIIAPDPGETITV